MQPNSRFHWQNLPILLLILLNLLIGALTVKDYGASWDEPGNFAYGEHSLQNFANLFSGQPVVDYNREHLDQKGPIFFMLVALAARLTNGLFPGALAVNTWHFVYFLSFQLGIVSLYYLICRWASPWAAFGATLLFATQPLLWGHAFMNPKDIPFMAFFLLSITSGLYLVDAMLDNSPCDESFIPFSKSFSAALRTDWQALPEPKKRATLFLSGGAILFGIFILAGKNLFSQWMTQFVTQAYTNANSLPGRIFHNFAQSAGNMPASYYMEKAQSFVGSFQILIGLLLIFMIILRFILTLNSLNPLAQDALRIFLRAFLDWRLLTAGISLGLTVSIRILGPLAGIIIALYALEKSFKRAIPAIAAYALVAIVIMFVTWPYLWSSPVGRFVETIRLMSKYVWTEPVLFNGTFYPPNQLPWYYLPELFSIQLTEPLLLLILVGLLVVMFRFKQYLHLDFAGLGIWFLAPLAGPILVGSTIYDNFRQFFFILPPLFVLAALGLDFVFDKLKNGWWRAGLVLILVLPGIYSGIKLHPYEYVYYNSFVGGTEGAFRHFEMDYWGTSYREAAEFLNKAAPANASVIVAGTDELFRLYSRPDLKVVSPDKALALGGKYDYFIALTRWDMDLKSCADGQTLAAISRGKAVFAVIRKLSGDEQHCP